MPTSKRREVRRVLADGTTRVYRYGPRKKPTIKQGDTVSDLIVAWEHSPEWREYAPTTKKHHAHYLRPLGAAAGRVSIEKVDRRAIIDLRNIIAERDGHGAATAFAKVVATLFSWAVENGRLQHSPAARMKRLKGGSLPAWTAHETTLALSYLPEHFRRAVVLALYTGQRRGDLIRLTWADYDGAKIRLVQQKTGARLAIPCHPALREELDRWRSANVVGIGAAPILTNAKGKPWIANNLTTQLGTALTKVPGFPPGKNIHGLRKLAAANLAHAGCTTHEIMAITGHTTLAMVELYTKSVEQERLADAAILRLPFVRP
jgi:integrase